MGWHCGCGPKSWDAGIGKGRRFEVAGVWVPGVEIVLEQKVWREKGPTVCGEVVWTVEGSGTGEEVGGV